MNAETLWQYYFNRQPFDLTTPRNKIFTVKMTSASMRFPSPTDQTRSISFDRFKDWFDLWFIKGYRQNKYFKNTPGSPSAVFRRVKVLFNSFDREDFLKYFIDVSEVKSPVLPQDYADFPDAVQQEITRIKRDSNLTASLKTLYSYKCQLCEFSFMLPSGNNYAEAHHIKPLGGGHNGKDSIGNLIVVCPNHHAMLDYGAMALNLNEINLSFPHKISEESVKYHNEIICSH